MRPRGYWAEGAGWHRRFGPDMAYEERRQRLLHAGIICWGHAARDPTTRLVYVKLEPVGGASELCLRRSHDLHVSLSYHTSDQDMRRLAALVNHRFYHIKFLDIRGGCAYLHFRCDLYATLTPFYHLRRGLHISF